MPPPGSPFLDWFRGALGEPAAFQKEAWERQLAGASGLIHAPTGTGKTLSVWGGPLLRWIQQHPDRDAWASMDPVGPRVLWITPLRALAVDTRENLRRPVEALGLPWTVQERTSDTPQALRQKQRKKLPTCLVTTPESLSVLLSYANAEEAFRGLETIVVDEWHELLSTKRGTQTELGLARLRTFNPAVQTWGLSATLGNLGEAKDCLLGVDPPTRRAREGCRLAGPEDAGFELTTLLPGGSKGEVGDGVANRFPWSGHLGIVLLDAVLDALEPAASTLLFTNTRSQSEIWYARICEARPQWLGKVALHHGSIDRETRNAVEEMLRSGELKVCVCTSSLDLGVDFSPVEQVIQVASPKGVARMLQRAGRSGHQPGVKSRIIGVPTNALEVLDFAAARDAGNAREIESRVPLDRPLDVAVQHLVTVAAGGGFDAEAMKEELRTAWSYRHLTDEEFGWCLDFVVRGGESLRAYPRFERVVEDPDRPGFYGVGGQKVARDHRMGIGTITSNAMISVLMGSKRLGTVEENFVGFLKPGDRFVFAGHLVQLVSVRQMVAKVKRASGSRGNVPRWAGGRSPLSTQLAAAVRRRLDAAVAGVYDNAEMRAIEPLLRLQEDWSRIPRSGELLIEKVRTRDGHHHFLFPLLGRLVHEGLGALLALRLTRAMPLTVVVTVNDYGVEVLTDDPLPHEVGFWAEVLSPENLLEDLLACVDTGQLARRQFRDIARIAGLIQTGYPGENRATKHLQASSELFFDVFTDFDPDNLLLTQAKREVLERQLEVARLRASLESLAADEIVCVCPDRLTPLGFPLFAERLREQHQSSQTWEERITRMAAELEAAADRHRPRVK
ncbi:ligase-associated DNA damage response DEXH box helicase [Phycisphaera mikurensis]|uniref:Putative ATP-dependent helicase n=1 Tax=Phycisphaera mikurensis (strain NBRC 102666 / KCTC 22515 / FYK2301M01) TaxID=1142394 RepID=I0IDA1_PHYMF|nr:ligase-associated DNA damage response DEXH box helicase [Phycisphaera mikurensis]MBB6442364.1 ATP-dependent Lhr-like helicase [Phycisphaera mikurensis]BAM03239.1 putative ATP-dependent helicase [Phycisphaera mikurensis NBRC 102666]